MPGLELPPWLEAARPADYMARGMGVGAELAGQRAAALRAQEAAAQRAQEFQQEMTAAQAAQQFKMQQAARAEQMQAQEQARADAELHLRASQAADKSKAIMQYQAAVSGGMDPLQAILQFGPAMGGQASPEAAALRASQIHKPEPPLYVPANADTGEPAHYLESGPGGGKRVAFPPRTTAAAAPVFVPESPETGPAHWESGGRITQAKVPSDISPSERAQTLAALRNQRKELLDASLLIEQKLLRKKPLTDAEKDVAAQLEDIQAQEQELLPKLKRSGTKTASSKSKVERAKEISAEHPDWTKAQVIKAVNDEFK
jgi:hypothetical protein